MNTPVSFPIAKLLKEKGFDEAALHFYCKNRTCNYLEKPYEYSFKVHANEERKINGEIDNFGYGLTWSAPYIAEVVMWLYEKHGIWIDVYYNSKYKSWDYEYTNINWSQEEVDKKLEEDIHNLLDNIFNAKIKYNSPTEAYEAAIEFTLENLI